MKQRPYSEVDVFSPTPYAGNPLAVVHDAEGLTTAQMQRFAKWTNLAETTFLLPPTSSDADYRLRIFTTVQELPFAGHPTLGSAAAWLAAGGRPQVSGSIVQESAAGLVTVRGDGRRFAFAAPPLTRYELPSAELVREIAAALGIPADRILGSAWLVNGPEWIGVRLSSADEVLALRPRPEDLGELCIGVVGPHAPGQETAVEVRAFIGGEAVWEDPVTGSLNAGLARWLTDSGQVEPHYVAAQGTVIGHEGRAHLAVDDADIWVGGDVTVCVRGEVRL